MVLALPTHVAEASKAINPKQSIELDFDLTLSFLIDFFCVCRTPGTKFHIRANCFWSNENALRRIRSVITMKICDECWTDVQETANYGFHVWIVEWYKSPHSLHNALEHNTEPDCHRWSQINRVSHHIFYIYNQHILIKQFVLLLKLTADHLLVLVWVFDQLISGAASNWNGTIWLNSGVAVCVSRCCAVTFREREPRNQLFLHSSSTLRYNSLVYCTKDKSYMIQYNHSMYMLHIYVYSGCENLITDYIYGNIVCGHLHIWLHTNIAHTHAHTPIISH